MNNKILITLIIGVCIVAAAGIIAFGMMNSHDVVVINGTNTTNTTNTTNHTNMTNNTTVEHVNSDGASQEVSQSTNHDDSSSQSTNHDDGFNHYTDDNGNAMVGNPNGQHMSEAEHQHVLANGMR